MVTTKASKYGESGILSVYRKINVFKVEDLFTSFMREILYDSYPY